MRKIEMDQETALVLLRSGQMPISRYIELCRERGWPLDPEMVRVLRRWGLAR